MSGVAFLLALTVAVSGGCDGAGGGADSPGGGVSFVTSALGSGPAQGGSYDRVSFTDDQAQAALDIANNATYAQLVNEATLTSTAARNIVAARDQEPIATMAALAAVPYVGPAALTDIRDYVSAWSAQNPQATPTGDVIYDGVTFTAAEIAKLLTFLNNPTLTVAELDGIVYVAPTHATAILDYLQTEPIDTIAELVGASDDAGASPLAGYQIESISRYAATWIAPSAGTSYEPIVLCGISFSAGEVETALNIVNNATLTQLDDDLALAANAAQAIVAARPIASMEALDGVSYVATQVFQRLKAYIPSWAPAASSPSVVSLQGGTYDGVAFTDAEGEDALDIANNATFDQLRYEATMTSRAANNIVAARPVVSMEELALISYVGTAALTDLKHYIPTWTAASGSPAASDAYEGVSFTVAEVQAALDMVNNATYDQLRYEATLTSTAANNIVAARPIATMGALAEVSYVGTAAMTDIKNYVPSWLAAAPDPGSGDGGGGGTYDGVTFTESEIALALDIANNATFDQLRYEATLTSTAANNVVAARPIATMEALAAVSYVGTAALTDIKSFIPSWTPTTPTPGQGGTFEGVVFSDDEARTALQIANTAIFDQLRNDATLTSTAAINIIAARPIATMDDLAAVSYVGAAAMADFKSYIPNWTGPGWEPTKTTIQDLFAEAVAHDAGTPSTLYDEIVTVERALLTSEPYTHSSGAVSFWVADPRAGNVEQVKIYVAASAGVDMNFASTFDDVTVTGKFTKYAETWEILIDAAGDHSIKLTTSGLAYEPYLTVERAHSSTTANPEGGVRVASDFGYCFMVPLPIFCDHPMWNGNDPGAPNDAEGPDTSWVIAAQNALDTWRAGGQQQPDPQPQPRYVENEILLNADDRSGGAGTEVWFDALSFSPVVPAGDNATEGPFAMTVKENGTEVPWSIDGEGEGWMLMVGGKVVLWGGVGRTRVYTPGAAYTVSYFTTDPAPVSVAQLSVQALVDEARSAGTSSQYFEQLVSLDRAIITTVPFKTSSGAAYFYIAAPGAGTVRQLRVYVGSAAGLDTSFLSIFDDIALTGRFVQYEGTWQMLLNDGAEHALSLTKSGLVYADYKTIQDAWAKTAANPEGAVRVVSSFGYTFMVPLPVFLDHPMWHGNPPGAPSSAHSTDHNWIIAATNALNTWLADPRVTYVPPEVTALQKKATVEWGMRRPYTGTALNQHYKEILYLTASELLQDSQTTWGGAVLPPHPNDQVVVKIAEDRLSGVLTGYESDILSQLEGRYFITVATLVRDFNGDGLSDFIVGASSAASGMGQAYVFYGPGNLSGTTPAANADVVLTGEGGWFGSPAADAGDVNGDGYPDLIVGAGACAKAYIFFGSDSPPQTMAASNANVTLTGATGSYFGLTAAGAGDVNGDGYTDVIVGAQGAAANLGEAYVFFGQASLPATIDASNAEVTMTGQGGRFGTSVAGAGDVNGDGYADVIVGAPRAASVDSGAENGDAYIFFGSASPQAAIPIASADVTLRGSDRYGYKGGTVASAGDLNGDGYSDVVVGMTESENPHLVCVYFGSASPPASILSADADITLRMSSYFGWSVAGAGDVNGDGYGDLIVSAPDVSDTYSHSGAAYVFFGSTFPTRVLVGARGQDVRVPDYADVILTGSADSDFFGGSVASAGDVNGDGYADVIVGANGVAGTTGYQTGAAYVFFGSATFANTSSADADLTLTGTAAGNNFGKSVSRAGK
ncbi:helix-hairpin-helix domain-containing protein [Planctomycetota bacterium]